MMIRTEYNETENIKKDESKKIKHNISPFSTTVTLLCTLYT